jgi:hypothetical protein
MELLLPELRHSITITDFQPASTAASGNPTVSLSGMKVPDPPRIGFRKIGSSWHDTAKQAEIVWISQNYSSQGLVAILGNILILRASFSSFVRTIG